MEAPPDLLAKYESRKGPGLNDTRYGAMIEALDTSFGKIMQYLENEGLSKNTLVIFTSDNGAPRVRGIVMVRGACPPGGLSRVLLG